ncbi:MAG: hypothetical protein C4312_07845, partial [Thermoflexus sp.]
MPSGGSWRGCWTHPKKPYREGSMAEVLVKWVEKRQFVGIDSTRHSVVISFTRHGIDIFGTEPDSWGDMTLEELWPIAMGAYLASDVLDILEKKRQAVTGLEVRVHGEQDPNSPLAFRRIHVHYRVRGRELSPKAVEDAVRLVSATVPGVAQITHSI